jgi:tetrahydromethanopterin S-methyltransferase subunit F
LITRTEQIDFIQQMITRTEQMITRTEQIDFRQQLITRTEHIQYTRFNLVFSKPHTQKAD